MTHSEYTAFFRDLASRHEDIQHTEQKKHFARMVLVDDPMLSAQFQIDEFLEGLAFKLLSPIVLLAAYDMDFRDERSDNIEGMQNGRLIILSDVKRNNFEEEEAIYEQCEEIGLDLISESHHILSDDPRKGMLEWNQVSSEKLRIKTRRQLAGVAYNFSILQTHVNTYRRNKFNPPSEV